MWSYYHIKLHDMGSKQLDYTFKHINIKGIIEHGSTNLWPTPSSMDEAKLFSPPTPSPHQNEREERGEHLPGLG